MRAPRFSFVKRYATSTAMTVLALAILAVPSSAQEIDTISPRGIMLGGSTLLTIGGSGFDDKSRVVLAGDVAVRSEIVSLSATELKVRVSLNREVQPGIVPLRIVTAQGVSNPRMVGVDRLPQRSFGEPISILPVALSGDLTGQQVLKTEFFATTGDQVVIDVEGQRLGSQLRPLMRVFSPSDRQVKSARPNPRLHGDARAVVRIGETGVYRVELQDLLFKGPKPGWFRMKIGQLDYSTGVFPMAVSAHGSDRVEFLGSNIRSAFTISAIQKQNHHGGMLMIPWDTDPTAVRTGVTPCIRLSEFGEREFTESAVADQRLSLPVGINGRLLESGEADSFRIKVRPGSKLRVELYGQRWGSPIDASLQVVDGNGRNLFNNDDRNQTTDPGGDFDIPGGVDQVTVRVSSVTGQGGIEHAYRLAIQEKPAVTASVSIGQREISMPANGRRAFIVQPNRQGAAPLWLQLPTALRGILKSESEQIAAEDEQGLWLLATAPEARGLFVTQPRGYLDDGVSPVALSLPAFPGSKQQPIFQQQMLVRIADGGQLAVNAVPAKPAYFARGSRLPVDVFLDRAPGNNRPVRLSLLTTQTRRTKKKDNKDVPAPEKELRLAETTILKGGAEHAQVSIVVPPGLPIHSWAFVIQAELLSDDQKNVLETASSALHRLQTIEPLSVTANLPKEQQVNAGGTASLSGRIERHPDFTFPVRVALSGVEGVDAHVIVPIGRDDFELVYEIPSDAKAVEYKGAALVASAANPNERSQEIRVQTTTFTVRTVAAK